MSKNKCPLPKYLNAFVNNKLKPESHQKVGVHIAVCPKCSAIVEALQSEPSASSGKRQVQPQPIEKEEPAEITSKAPAVTPTTQPVTAATPKSKASASSSPLMKIVTTIVVLGSIGAVANHFYGDAWFGDKSETAGPVDPTIPPLPDKGPSVPEQNAVPAETDTPAQTGFVMGDLTGSVPIENVKVTITAGPDGDIDEVVDLHLGFGFPLRLTALQPIELGPVFAALPTSSSLDVGTQKINAGQPATFEFSQTENSNDRDPLKTSNFLLSDLKVSDICQIGFAAKGRSNWSLAGYRIEINGKRFASNNSFNLNPHELNQDIQPRLAELIGQHDALVNEVNDLEFVIRSGLATDLDQQRLDEKKAQLNQLVQPIDQLGGQLLGHRPNLPETSDQFVAPAADADSLSSVRISLIPGGQDKPGTLNPVYLQAGGRKFLLASEVSPLQESDPQSFEISSSDLKLNPIGRDQLEQFAIGVIGSNEPFDQIPDRAALQRVLVEADGDVVYDSELSLGDRNTLNQTTLIPPAHRDDQGDVVLNAASETVLYAWRPGLLLSESPEIVEQLPVEPVPPLPPYETVTSFGPTVPVNSTTNGARPIPNSFSPIRADSVDAPARIGVGDLLIALLLKDLIDRLGNPSTKGDSDTNPNPAPIPAAKKLQIHNVRFGPLQRMILPVEGSATQVVWEVENPEDVKEYQVRLWFVMPHFAMSQSGLRSFALLVSESAKIPNRDNRKQMIASLPAIDLSSVTKVEERAHGFLKPEVIAFDSKGKVIPNPVGSDGPLLPILTKGSQREFSTMRSSTIPLLATDFRQSIQVSGDGFDPPESIIPWIPYSGVPNNDGRSSWILGKPANAHNAMTFESPAASPVVGVSSWDPAITQLTLRFDNPIKLDGNYRMVGHLGFIDLINSNVSSTNPVANSKNEVSLQARIIVQNLSPAGRLPVAPHGIATVGSAAIPQLQEVLRIETSAPLTYSKVDANTPLMLIDIPIALDLNGAAYSTALNKNGKTPKLQSLSGLKVTNFPSGAAPLGAMNKSLVSLTLMLKMKRDAAHQAIGLFGLRLVRDPR